MTIESVIDYLRLSPTALSTRALANQHGVDQMELFLALNAEAKRGRLVRSMVLEPSTGTRDLLCIGWSCPTN